MVKNIYIWKGGLKEFVIWYYKIKCKSDGTKLNAYERILSDGNNKNTMQGILM